LHKISNVRRVSRSKLIFRTASICALLILGAVAITPLVRGQTTSISHVVYPSTVIYDLDTEMSAPPLLVKATVTYEGAGPGFSLATGVFDLGTSNLVAGVGSSSPSSCETTSQFAGCDIPLSTSQGSDTVEFLLGRPQNVWNLAIISGLLNSTDATISNSLSNYTFTITVHTGLTLQVEAPIPVQVTIDGVNGTGTVRLKLEAGSHAVSVPQTVPFGNGTRLRFTGWSDGSAVANRTVALNHDITLEANYVTQYRLTIISPEVNVTGAEWYDNGSKATLSVPSTELPMSGPLGVLGGRWIFIGWSEDGGPLSKLITQTVDVNSPHTMRAEWQADYSLPITIFALVLLVVGLAVTLRPFGATSRGQKSRRKGKSQGRVSRNH
jgi:hypothetical protein